MFHQMNMVKLPQQEIVKIGDQKKHKFILGLGDVPAINPAEEALDQEGWTIADDVCTMIPFALGYFGISRLIPFDGPTPTIREPQRTPNPAGGYTPHLMVDYHRHVAEIHRQHAQALYDETKDLRIEYRFWQPFYFDFYHHLIYLRYINNRGSSGLDEVH